MQRSNRHPLCNSYLRRISLPWHTFASNSAKKLRRAFGSFGTGNIQLGLRPAPICRTGSTMNIDRGHRNTAHVFAEAPTLRHDCSTRPWIGYLQHILLTEVAKMTPTQMLLCMAASEATVTCGDGSLGFLLAPLHRALFRCIQSSLVHRLPDKHS